MMTDRTKYRSIVGFLMNTMTQHDLLHYRYALSNSMLSEWATVAKSSCAAELAAADSCLDDIIWSRETTLWMDNKAAIANIKRGDTT